MFTDIFNLYCDLDLGHSNPLFSQDTQAYDDVPSNYDRLQNNLQFRRYSRNSDNLIMWALTVTLTFKTANQSFCMTVSWQRTTGQWGGDSSVGRASHWKARHNTDSASSLRRSKEFFLPASTSSADSLTVSIQPPCAIACINICEHTKNPKHWQPYHCLDTILHTHW